MYAISKFPQVVSHGSELLCWQSLPRWVCLEHKFVYAHSMEIRELKIDPIDVIDPRALCESNHEGRKEFLRLVRCHRYAKSPKKRLQFGNGNSPSID